MATQVGWYSLFTTLTNSTFQIWRKISHKWYYKVGYCKQYFTNYKIYIIKLIKISNKHNNNNNVKTQFYRAKVLIKAADISKNCIVCDWRGKAPGDGGGVCPPAPSTSMAIGSDWARLCLDPAGRIDEIDAWRELLALLPKICEFWSQWFESHLGNIFLFVYYYFHFRQSSF